MSLEISEADLAEITRFIEEQEEHADPDLPDFTPMIAEVDRLVGELRAATAAGNHLRALSSCVALPHLVETIAQVHQFCMASNFVTASDDGDVAPSGYV